MTLVIATKIIYKAFIRDVAIYHPIFTMMVMESGITEVMTAIYNRICNRGYQAYGSMVVHAESVAPCFERGC